MYVGSCVLVRLTSVVPTDWHNCPHLSKTAHPQKPQSGQGIFPGDTPGDVQWLFDRAWDITLFRMKNLANSVTFLSGGFRPDRYAKLEAELRPKVPRVHLELDSGVEDSSLVPAKLHHEMTVWVIPAHKTATGIEHRAIVDMVCHPSYALYSMRGLAGDRVKGAVRDWLKLDWAGDGIYNAVAFIPALNLLDRKNAKLYRQLATRPVKVADDVGGEAEEAQLSNVFKELILLVRDWRQTRGSHGLDQQQDLASHHGSIAAQLTCASLCATTGAAEAYSANTKPDEDRVFDVAVWSAKGRLSQWKAQVSHIPKECRQVGPLMGGSFHTTAVPSHSGERTQQPHGRRLPDRLVPSPRNGSLSLHETSTQLSALRFSSKKGTNGYWRTQGCPSWTLLPLATSSRAPSPFLQLRGKREQCRVRAAQQSRLPKVSSYIHEERVPTTTVNRYSMEHKRKWASVSCCQSTSAGATLANTPWGCEQDDEAISEKDDIFLTAFLKVYIS